MLISKAKLSSMLSWPTRLVGQIGKIKQIIEMLFINQNAIFDSYLI